MRRRGRGAAFITGMLVAVCAPPAHAATTTVDFDSFLPGAIVGSVPASGVTFPANPEAFTPANVVTQSPPRALRNSAGCNDLACSNKANELRMRFNPPVSKVELFAGVDDGVAFEFPTRAQLRGFALGGGTPIDQSPLTEVAQPNAFGPITTPLSVTAPAGQMIHEAVVYTGGDGIQDFPGRQRGALDSLTLTRPDAPGGEVGPAFVTIASPPTGEVYATPQQVPVLGFVRVSPGQQIREFCVRLNATSYPDKCFDARTLVRTSDPLIFHFPYETKVQLRAGPNIVTAWAKDQFGRVYSDRRAVQVGGPSGSNFRMIGLEATQGVQTPDGFAVRRDGPRLDFPGLGRGLVGGSSGLRFAANKTTVVRAMASQSGGVRGQIPMRLHAFRLSFVGAQARIDRYAGPLAPTASPDSLPTDESGFGAAGTSKQHYYFTLPWTWTRGTGARSLFLVAEINPRAVHPRVGECAGCESDNLLALGGVAFNTVREVPIKPLYLTGGRQPGDSPSEAQINASLGSYVRAMPAPVRVYRPVGGTNVSDLISGRTQLAAGVSLMDALFDRVNRWRNNSTVSGHIAGYTTRAGGGIGAMPGPTSVSGIPSGYVAAHELIHNHGIPHASAACGAVGGVNQGEDWPPDQRGRLQGRLLDVRPGTDGRHTVRIDTDSAPLYDFMSYCGGENDTWIGPRNWTRMVNGLRFGGPTAIPGPPAGAGGTPSGAAARVSGLIAPDGRTTITAVEQTNAPVTAAAPSTALRLTTRAPGGGPLASIPFAPEVAAYSHGKGASAYPFSVVVPQRGVSAVEVAAGNRVLATRRRSATAPRVSVRAPRRRARVRGLTVRWRMSDADRDALSVAVDLSTNGGRRWSRVWSGQGGTSVRLAGRLLPASRRARIRVTVNDGFNETRATSARFRTLGTPPSVFVISPIRGAGVASDARLTLEGQAHDDRGGVLKRRRLVWLSGRRVLGRGERVDVPAARIGSSVTLRATDRFGRRASRRVRVRVKRVAARFVNLSAPRRVGRRARSLVLRTGVTQPAMLKVSGKGVRPARVPLTGRRRAVRVRVKPGRSRLSLRLRLRSGGRTTTLVIRIAR